MVKAILTRNKTIAILLWLQVFAAVVSYAERLDLPDIGDRARNAISPAEESALGKQIIAQMRHQLPFIDDPAINEYISELGQRLVSRLEAPQLAYSFYIVDIPSINAFALPGGYIVVNSGLVRKSRTEGELASVMSHEIVHVSQRHIARTVDRGKLSGLSNLAGILAAIILIKQDPQLGQAALTAAVAASVQSQINFTRENEAEADRVGIQLLASAGFDPRSMPAFFRRLKADTRYYGEIPAFLSTHPITDVRIAEGEQRARALSKKYQKQANEQAFLLTQSQLIVLAEDAATSVQYFKAKLQADSTLQRTVARYGLALALQKQGNFKQAKQAAQLLLGKDPYRIAYQLLLGNIERDAGNLSVALRIYAKTLKLNPNNLVLTMHYTQALLMADQAQQAVKILRRHAYQDGVQQLPAVLYELIARAEGQAGNLIAARRAQAEYYFQSSQLETAVRQLRLALADKNITQDQRLLIEARILVWQKMTVQKKQAHD